MSARVGVGVVAALLVVYLVLVAQRAWLLVSSGEPVGVAMGVALVVLPVLAAWALWRELSFGFRSSRLARLLEAEGGMPADDVAVRPSGRAVRADADALFPSYRAEVEAHPEDWRAWFRLGLAHDGAGDRRRARAAVRQAIALEAAERRRGGTPPG